MEWLSDAGGALCCIINPLWKIWRWVYAYVPLLTGYIHIHDGHLTLGFQFQIYSFTLSFVMVGHRTYKLCFPDSPGHLSTNPEGIVTRSSNTIHRSPQPEVWTTGTPQYDTIPQLDHQEVDYMRHIPSWKQQQFFPQRNRHSVYGFASVVGRILGRSPISSNSQYIYPVKSAGLWT